MTTRVTVTNHGPNAVQVKLMDRWIDRSRVTVPDMPPYTTALESKYRGPPLMVGESQEFYVHGDQELHVVELAHNRVDETPPSR